MTKVMMAWVVGSRRRNRRRTSRCRWRTWSAVAGFSKMKPAHRAGLFSISKSDEFTCLLLGRVTAVGTVWLGFLYFSLFQGFL